MAFRSKLSRYRLYKVAMARANRDGEYAHQILADRTYWGLIREGLPGDILFEICVLFHALTKVRESFLVEFHRHGGVLERGRPSDFFPLFQLICFMLASRYGRGRQFREEFCKLTFLVFGKQITSDSYRTTLKRVRRGWLATLSLPSGKAPSRPFAGYAKSKLLEIGSDEAVEAAREGVTEVQQRRATENSP